MDPMDGLVVICQAALDALEVQSQRGVNSEYPALWDLPYIDLSTLPTGSTGLLNSGGRSVTRLHDQIQNLRLDDDQLPTSESRDNLMVATAVKKQLEAEAIAEKALRAYRSEQQKRADLQVLLSSPLCFNSKSSSIFNIFSTIFLIFIIANINHHRFMYVNL